jgi:DNA ligase (NAD+)
MKNSQDTKKRISALRAEIEKHRHFYHTEDAPEISDEAYDALVRELSELDPSFVVPVGGKILDGFSKTKHLVPQWSYDNVFGFDELKRWDERNRKIITPSFRGGQGGVLEYCCELKIDGLKIVLTYKDGKLVTGATRGDGSIGENITENIKMIKSIPHNISEKRELVVIGEVWMKKSDLEKINKERAEQGLPLYANPRNLAAGTLRQLDTNIVASRDLQVFCYDLEILPRPSATPSWKEGEPQGFLTHEHKLKFLKDNKFPVNSKTKTVSTLEEIQEFVDTWIPLRNHEEYAVDGVVIKLNDVSLREVLLDEEVSLPMLTRSNE